MVSNMDLCSQEQGKLFSVDCASGNMELVEKNNSPKLYYSEVIVVNLIPAPKYAIVLDAIKPSVIISS